MTNLTRLLSAVCDSRFLKRSPIFLAALFGILSANVAQADAIYTFSLPANGAVSALSFSLRAPDLLPPGGLLIIPVTAPVVTDFSFPTPGFTTTGSVIGFQVTPTATLVGLALLNSPSGLALVTPSFPGDFFQFPRTPTLLGTFPSTSGNVISSLQLATPSPSANLTVSVVPEPLALVMVISGLSLAGLWRIRGA